MYFCFATAVLFGLWTIHESYYVLLVFQYCMLIHWNFRKLQRTTMAMTVCNSVSTLVFSNVVCY